MQLIGVILSTPGGELPTGGVSGAIEVDKGRTF